MAQVVIVDFPEAAFVFKIELAEVVFAVRIVVSIEPVEAGNDSDKIFDLFGGSCDQGLQSAGDQDGSGGRIVAARPAFQPHLDFHGTICLVGLRVSLTDWLRKAARSA